MTSRLSRLYAAIVALLLLGLGAHANGQNVLSLDRTSYTVAESAANASIIVRLARTNTDSVTVNYTTNDGTALAGADYTATNGTLTFGPNETAKLVQIPILDDLTPESTEQFMLMISNPSGATIDPARSSATVTIQDNDGTGTIIGFDPASYSPNENAGSVTLTVLRSGDLSRTDTVNYTTTPGSATGGESPGTGIDYQNTEGTLTFAPNEPSMTITVPIFDDQNVEGNETFAVNLTGPGALYDFDQSTATVTIIEIGRAHV